MYNGYHQDMATDGSQIAHWLIGIPHFGLKLAQGTVFVVLLGQQLLQAERGERNPEEGQHRGRAGHHTVGRRGAGGERMTAVCCGLRGERSSLQKKQNMKKSVVGGFSSQNDFQKYIFPKGLFKIRKSLGDTAIFVQQC